jgi:type IV fimbrial biogenesis protein FimT
MKSMSFAPSKPQSQGFTLLELLTVVAVMAVVLGIATPSFKEFMDRRSMRSNADQLNAALQSLQAESLRNGGNVLLVRQVGCGVNTAALTVWTCGWQLGVDANANGTLDTTETVILSHQNADTSIRISNFNANATLTGNQWGQVQGSTGFVVQPVTATLPADMTAVCIYIGGRIVLRRKTNGC